MIERLIWRIDFNSYMFDYFDYIVDFIRAKLGLDDDRYVMAGTKEGTNTRLYLNNKFIERVYCWDSRKKYAYIFMCDSKGNLYQDANGGLILGRFYLPDAVVKKAQDLNNVEDLT